jgi:Gluconate 2-dehydrogenase subunit 3
MPKFFSPRQYETLCALCQAIIPPDTDSGGAVEAGAPEFIDLLTSENHELQLQLGGGIMWLDSTCAERYQQTYLECTGEQQKEILDLIAIRRTPTSILGCVQAANFSPRCGSSPPMAFLPVISACTTWVTLEIRT